jgi:putative redox protein
MSYKVNVAWAGEMSFATDIMGQKITMDAAPDAGGKDRGPLPKELSLISLGGCTGMDVIPILAKMRVFPESFNMYIEAEAVEEHPKVFKKIHIVYAFTGKDLPLEKIQKAIDLSQTKYCSVSAMLNKSADISYEIKINDQ